MKFQLTAIISLMLSFVLSNAICQDITHKTTNPKYHLIAHRGGIVDNSSAENSLSGLEKAAAREYWMVEIDLRLTKDSVLITQHDSNFKRNLGVDSIPSSMTWDQISKLKGPKGNKVLKFEDLLKYCHDHKLGVMIDNKIRGNDTVLFTRVTDLLKKYDLSSNALMIGTEESTAFFTGKVKLSCTRKQLEDNMLKPDYKSSDYYLFSGHITKADADWASQHHILAIGVINAWGLKSADPMLTARKQAEDLKSAGVTYFQIDSDFETFFQ